MSNIGYGFHQGADFAQGWHPDFAAKLNLGALDGLPPDEGNRILVAEDEARDAVAADTATSASPVNSDIRLTSPRAPNEGARAMVTVGVAVSLELLLSGERGLAIMASAENFDFLPFRLDSVEEVEFSDMMVDIAVLFQAAAPVEPLPVEDLMTVKSKEAEQSETPQTDEAEATA